MYLCVRVLTTLGLAFSSFEHFSDVLLLVSPRFLFKLLYFSTRLMLTLTDSHWRFLSQKEATHGERARTSTRRNSKETSQSHREKIRRREGALVMFPIIHCFFNSLPCAHVDIAVRITIALSSPLCSQIRHAGRDYQPPP